MAFIEPANTDSGLGVTKSNRMLMTGGCTRCRDPGQNESTWFCLIERKHRGHERPPDTYGVNPWIEPSNFLEKYRQGQPRKEAPPGSIL